MRAARYADIWRINSRESVACQQWAPSKRRQARKYGMAAVIALRYANYDSYPMLRSAQF